ncbi:hypothetical protein CBL_00757 [Carabus blaptoides fortunei]
MDIQRLTGHILFQLDGWFRWKNSSKYQELLSKMQGNFFKSITGIYQLQNPLLYNQFQLKVAETALNGNVAVSVSPLKLNTPICKVP